MMLPFGRVCASIFRSGLSNIWAGPSGNALSTSGFGGGGRHLLHTGRFSGNFNNATNMTYGSPQMTNNGSIMCSALSGLLSSMNGQVHSALSWNPIRTIIRIHFPRPSETKRIKHRGWVKRMSTPSQRRIIMRRILKNRHHLSH